MVATQYVAQPVPSRWRPTFRPAPVTARTPKMSSTKIIAIVLIVAGVLGLAYGKFTYTKETHDAKVGPIELSVKDKETVNIPMWAGIGAIVVGAGVLLAGGRKI